MPLNLKSAGGGAVTLTPASTPTDVTLTVPATSGTLAVAESLAASGGAAGVGYLPSGTGAVATTVQGKLRERKSVLDFGVSTGNTAAANATAFLAAIESGFPLEVPSGSYLCASIVSTRTNQIDMVGADSQELGRGTSLFFLLMMALQRALDGILIPSIHLFLRTCYLSQMSL